MNSLVPSACRCASFTQMNSHSICSASEENGQRESDVLIGAILLKINAG